MGARVTVRSLLIAINSVVLCLTEYIALSHGKHQVALVALAVNVLNIVYIHLGFKTRNDYLKIFSFVTLLHLLHRIPFFVDPSRTGTYSPSLTVLGFASEREVTYSLLVILAYLVVGGVTILVCGQMFRLHLYLDRTSEIDRDFSPLFVWYLLLQMVFLYDYLILGAARRGIESHPLGWIGLVLSSELALVLLAFGIFINWKRNDHAWFRFLATLYFVITLVITTVWGSRRGIYQYLTMGLITMMTVWANRKWYFGLKKLVLASALILSAVATYVIGTEYRRVVLFQSSRSTVEAIMSVDVAGRLSAVWDERELVFQKIWYRMSQLDDVMIAILMETSRFAHEINVVNNLKVFANYLVIGDVFPGILPTGRAWEVDYYGTTLEEASENYNTFVPGAIGFSVATFGVIWGLLGLSVVIWLFVVGAKWGSFWVPLGYRKYYAFAIYYLFFGHLIGGMGLDVLAFAICLWIIQAGLMVGFVTSYNVFRHSLFPRLRLEGYRDYELSEPTSRSLDVTI